MPTVQQSPFLDAKNTAEVLNTSALNVMRLCAKGVLQCQYLNGQIRIRPEDVEAFASNARLSAYLDHPEWDDSGWFENDDCQSYASAFRGSVIAAMKSYVESLGPNDFPKDAKGNAILDVAFPAERIARIINAPVRPLVNFANQPQAKSPYDNQCEAYAVHEVRQHALRAVPDQTVTNAMLGLGASPILRFYSGKEVYRFVADKAWQRFQDASIAVSRTFALPKFSNPQTVTWRLQNSRLPVTKYAVESLAF